MADKTDKPKARSIYLPPELAAWIEEAAKRQDRSQNWVMVNRLTKAMNEDKKGRKK